MDVHPREARTTVSCELSQWKYLSIGAHEHEMHAVLTVRVTGTGRDGGPGPALAQVLAIDCSGSMAWPPEKLRAAKRAAAAALRLLPDGTPFAVVRGTESASMVYPSAEHLARADTDRRAEAQRAVHHLVTGGGTCIGTWLDLSRRLLTEQNAPIGHVLLLTDGKNMHDVRMPLEGVLDACAGRFVCDAWGIGDDWDAQELLRITSRLHGSAASVREVSALPREYEKLMHRLLAKIVPELVISVTPMPGATVRYLKQVFPTEAELPAAGPEQDGGSRGFVTRAWGDETRRYQLCLSADPTGQPRGEDLQLAVVALEAPADQALRLPPPLPCLVHWTDDPALSRQSDIQVDHFEQHSRLGQAIGAAADAYRRGEHDRAEQCLGTAVRLAHAIGATDHLARLEQLVEILDAAAGRVGLRTGLAPVDFEHVIITASRSTYGPGEPTGSGGSGPAGPAGPAGGTVRCPECGEQAPADANFCPTNGHPLREQP